MVAQVADNFDSDNFKKNVEEHATSRAVRDAVFDLLEFSYYNASKIEGGHARFGSFHYQIDVGSRTVTLFTCDINTVSVSLGNFDRLTMVEGKHIARLRRTIAQIPCDSKEEGPRGFDSFQKSYDTRPGFIIRGTIDNPEALDKFKKAIITFQNSIN